MKKLTRRDMLKLAGLTTAGAALAACTPTVQPTTVGKTEGKTEDQAKAPEPTKAPPKKAPVKITIVESWFGIPQYKEILDPVMNAISDKMAADGVPVIIESMILEDHENKYPLLYASGAEFTMAFDAPWYKMNTLRDQGALVQLESLVETMGPKLKEEITEKIFNANLQNGHLYGVPAAYYYSGTGGVIYREDLRAKYNVPAPTSEEGWTSLEPYLKALLENEKGMIPFANVTTQSMAGYTRSRRGWAPGPTKTGVGVPDITKGFQLMDSEDDPYGIEANKLLHEWWKAGYINKTDLTFSGSSQNAQIDYLYPGKAGACVENEPDYKWVDQSKQMKSTNPDAELRGMDMTGIYSGKSKGIGNLKQWNFIVFNAGAPKEQHEAGIQFFNWLSSSQDNLDLWLMGVDGVNYKKEDNLRFSEVDGVDAARNYRRMWYVSGMGGRFQRQPVDLPPEAEKALTFFSTEENWIFNPYEQFEADTKALEVDSAKLAAVYDEASHGLNTGQEPTEQAMAKMKQMLDDAGRQEYKKKLQAQLDAFMASQK